MSDFNEAIAFDELNFLSDFIGDRKQKYCEAYWLKSDFESHVWKCDLGNCKTINFKIRLSDGSYLTDLKHGILLKTLKCFLCIQTHRDVTGGKKLVDTSAYTKLRRALHIIDYWLLHAEEYQLAKIGLAGLSENDLSAMLQKILSQSNIAETVYNWADNVSLFLKEKIAFITEEDIKKTTQKMHSLSILAIDYADRKLLFTDTEVLKARVWIKMNGFYKASQNRSEYKYVLNTRKLSQIIFKNTLAGCNAVFPNFDELAIGNKLAASREFQGSPTRTKNHNAMSERLVNKYYKTLKSLGCLSNIDLPVPIDGLNQLNLQALKLSLRLGDDGRFSSLPSQVVFNALRNSIEFALMYGDIIVEGYLTLVRAARQTGVSTHRLNELIPSMCHFLSTKLKSLGVKCWSIIDKYNLEQERTSDYFDKVRANSGLHELIKILYGAVQLCVGTLMARRQAELLDLKAFNCLDKDGKYLIFYVRKTGYDNKREKVARPIPKIAVKLIKLIETLQKGLIDEGVLNCPAPLFAIPNLNAEGLTKCTSPIFNNSIDLFCDYFQLPLSHKNQRYYIRQHQLRRFFAMLFFWGNSFSDMDTLRWFLAHADVEHLYHYITESVTGSVLKDAKAHYAVEKIQSLKEYDDSFMALSNVLEKHFGTRKFDVLDSEHLAEYIKDLLDTGEMEIEPEFFETANGKKYQIMVLVKQKGAR